MVVEGRGPTEASGASEVSEKTQGIRGVMSERDLGKRSTLGDEDAGSERSESLVSRRFGPFVYDPLSETLTGPEGEIRLRPQVFQLLGLLIREAPRPVPPQRLIDEIWDVTHVSAGSIQRTVSELRTALGDDARSPAYVETVHRRGYRFVATLESVAAKVVVVEAGVEADLAADPREGSVALPELVETPPELSEGESSSPPASDAPSSRPKTTSAGPRWSGLRTVGALVLGTALVGAMWWAGVLGDRGSGVSEPGGTAPVPAVPSADDASGGGDGGGDDPSELPLARTPGWPTGEAGNALVENADITVRLLPPFLAPGQEDPMSVHQRFKLLDPAVQRSPEVRLGLAKALTELGWHQQAREQLQELLETPPAPEAPEVAKETVLGAEALHHELAGDGDKALELRRTLATFFPDDFEHALALAQAERRFGDAARAEDILSGLETGQEAGQETLPRLRVELESAEVQHSRGNTEQMLASALRAAEIARRLDRPYRLAQALLLSGRARHHLSRQSGMTTEAVADLAAAADLFERLHVARGASEAQVVWATLLYEQERFAGAREIAEKSLAAAESLGDPVRIARSRLQLGRIAVSMAELDQAIEEITAAMAAYEQAGREIGASAARTSLAELRYRQGRLDLALSLLADSLAVYRRRQRWENIASAASNTAMVALELGRWSAAERSLAEAAEARGHLHDHGGSPYIRLSSARLALGQGRLEQALDHGLEALGDFRRLERSSGLLATYQVLAQIDEARGDLRSAARRLQEAAALPMFSSSRPGSPEDGADVKRRFSLALSQARVAMYMGSFRDPSRGSSQGSASQVESRLQLAERLLPEIKEPKLKALFLQTHGRWKWWQGDLETGRREMTEALEEWRTSGRAAMESRARLELAELAIEEGRLDAAEQQIRSALERSRDLGDHSGIASAWALRAGLELRRNHFDVAQTYARISRESGPLNAHADGDLCLTSAQVDLASGRTDAAEQGVQTVLDRAEEAADCRLLVDALVASARLQQETGRSKEAAGLKKQAADQAAACGYASSS